MTEIRIRLFWPTVPGWEFIAFFMRSRRTAPQLLGNDDGILNDSETHHNPKLERTWITMSMPDVWAPRAQQKTRNAYIPFTPRLHGINERAFNLRTALTFTPVITFFPPSTSSKYQRIIATGNAFLPHARGPACGPRPRSKVGGSYLG